MKMQVIVNVPASRKKKKKIQFVLFLKKIVGQWFILAQKVHLF